MTPEDLYDFRFLADAQISPDGTRVAYVVRVIDREKNAYRSAVWLVPADGSAPGRQLTFGPGQDALPRWSPDGRRIAFVSDRAAATDAKRKPRDVFVLSLDGGDSRRLTSFAEDCGDLAWAPDGRHLAFTVKEPKAAEAADDAPKVYDRVRYKTDEGFLLDGRRRHVWIADADGGGEARRLTDGDWDDAQPSWSPDGRDIAFVSNRTGARERNTVADVWVAAVADGAVRRITDERGSYGNPSWSPDGTGIGCYGVEEAIGSSAKNVHVFTFPAGGGVGRDLTASWDRTVGSAVMSDMRSHVQMLAPVWTADRSRVVFVGSDRGTANVYSVPAAGGEVRSETVGAHQVVSLSLSSDAARFACVLSDATDPGNVAAGELGRSMRTLTDLNGELLRGRYLAAPERLELIGADGWPIEGWLMKPRGFDPSRTWPLVLEVHGGPHGAYGHGFFHEFHVLAGRGYAVLYTNPRGSQAYGEAFSAACVGDWGGKDYADLMLGVDHALAWPWVDARRLYVTGGSYGGFMTNWIVGHTDRFRAAATQRSISNNVSAFGTSDIGWHFWEHEMGDASPWKDPARLVERSPLTYAPKVKTPLLILHAERDLRCPIEQAEQLFVALRLHGVETVFVRFQEDNHDLTRGGKPRNRVEHCRRIADWFDAHA